MASPITGWADAVPASLPINTLPVAKVELAKLLNGIQVGAPAASVPNTEETVPSASILLIVMVLSARSMLMMLPSTILSDTIDIATFATLVMMPRSFTVTCDTVVSLPNVPAVAPLTANLSEVTAPFSILSVVTAPGAIFSPITLKGASLSKVTMEGFKTGLGNVPVKSPPATAPSNTPSPLRHAPLAQ